MTQLVPRYDSMAFRRDSAVFEDCLSSVRDKYCVPLFLSDSEFIDNAHLNHCSHTVITNIFDHQTIPHRYRDEKSILRVAAAVVTERVWGYEYLIRKANCQN